MILLILYIVKKHTNYICEPPLAKLLPIIMFTRARWISNGYAIATVHGLPDFDWTKNVLST